MCKERERIVQTEIVRNWKMKIYMVWKMKREWIEEEEEEKIRTKKTKAC